MFETFEKYKSGNPIFYSIIEKHLISKKEINKYFIDELGLEALFTNLNGYKMNKNNDYEGITSYVYEDRINIDISFGFEDNPLFYSSSITKNKLLEKIKKLKNKLNFSQAFLKINIDPNDNSFSSIEITFTKQKELYSIDLV